MARYFIQLSVLLIDTVNPRVDPYSPVPHPSTLCPIVSGLRFGMMNSVQRCWKVLISDERREEGGRIMEERYMLRTPAPSIRHIGASSHHLAIEETFLMQVERDRHLPSGGWILKFQVELHGKEASAPDQNQTILDCLNKE